MRGPTAVDGRFVATVTRDGGRVHLTLLISDEQGVRTGSVAGDFDGRDLTPAVTAVSSVLHATVAALGPEEPGLPRGPGLDAVRRRCPNAYRPWTADDERRLAERYRAGATIQALTTEFGRSRGGIRARLERLGLVAVDGSERHGADGTDDSA